MTVIAGISRGLSGVAGNVDGTWFSAIGVN